MTNNIDWLVALSHAAENRIAYVQALIKALHTRGDDLGACAAEQLQTIIEAEPNPPPDCLRIAGRRVRVDHIRPPIPTHDYDWRACIDRGDEGDPLGYGSTPEAAIADLRDQLEAE